MISPIYLHPPGNIILMPFTKRIWMWLNEAEKIYEKLLTSITRLKFGQYDIIGALDDEINIAKPTVSLYTYTQKTFDDKRVDYEFIKYWAEWFNI